MRTCIERGGQICWGREKMYALLSMRLTSGNMSAEQCAILLTCENAEYVSVRSSCIQYSICKQIMYFQIESVSVEHFQSTFLAYTK